MAISSEQEVRLFLHLADSLHFARSAKALHMSPSALTRAVQKLERELGQPLFQRSKRRVALTRAGEIFRDYARAQLVAHARLQEALATERRMPTGELRVACTVTACHSVLPRLLARCRERYPGIHLQLSTSDAARCMQALENDEVDLAVVPEPEPPPAELRFVRLTHTDLSFIAPAADGDLARRARLGGGHWSGLPLILARRGVDRQRIDAWLEQLGARPEIYAEVDGNEAILAMVALGCGVGVVPELVRRDSPFRGRIQQVKVEPRPRGYHVSLCAKSRTLSRRTAAAFWELAPAAF
ncbi:MAG TPA: HTH-type transcriptional activator IlvY [Polyangia bacterium]|nr:HTH-type transcriptional activator IlvY [Polyangia bacterium]